jgi:hypothetical protein
MPRRAEDDEFGTVAAAVIGDVSGAEPRVRLRASDLLERAWSIYRRRLSTFVSLFWGVVVIQWVVMRAFFFLMDELIESVREPNFTEACQFIVFLGRIVIPVWLTIGQIKFTLALIRDEPAVVEDIFGGPAYVLTMLLAAIPVLLVVALPTYGGFRLGDQVLSAPEGLTLKTVTLAILSWVGGMALSLYLLARLGQFQYLIVDRRAGAVRALTQSWRLTRGRATTLMAITILLAGINLVGFVVLLVGVLLQMTAVGMNAVGLVVFMAPLVLTLPFTSLATALVYDTLAVELPADEVDAAGDAIDSQD